MIHHAYPPVNPTDWPGLCAADIPRFRVAVVGEVRIDIRTRLAGVRFRDLQRDTLAFAPVDLRVSGTATNFARFAVNYFAEVELIAKIGQDSFTSLIRSSLDELGITSHLLVDPNAANGLVIVVRDDAERGAGQVRLMVADTASPAAGLNRADIDSFADPLAKSDALFVDGYAMLNPHSAQAVYAAAAITHAAGGTVCFDLVPHDIHERISLSDVLPALELSDVILSQADTLSGLFGVPYAETHGVSLGRLAPVLNRAITNSPLWLIRSGGPNSIDVVSAYQKGKLQRVYPTGYRSPAEPIGFGDRLAACELYWLLSARHRKYPAALPDAP